MLSLEPARFWSVVTEHWPDRLDKVENRLEHTEKLSFWCNFESFSLDLFFLVDISLVSPLFSFFLLAHNKARKFIAGSWTYLFQSTMYQPGLCTFNTFYPHRHIFCLFVRFWHTRLVFFYNSSTHAVRRRLFLSLCNLILCTYLSVLRDIYSC